MSTLRDETMSTLRESLIAFLTSRMEFRRDLAQRERRPNGKNSNHAESLEVVIAHIAALPDEDATLRRLATCGDGVWWTDFGFGDWEAAIHDMTIHCGSRDYPLDAASAGDWFQRWAELVCQEVQAHTSRAA
jgi:hypothetical protein